MASIVVIDIPYNCFILQDIVDTTPYIGTLNGDALIKILLGGVNRRVDKHGAAAIR